MTQKRQILLDIFGTRLALKVYDKEISVLSKKTINECIPEFQETVQPNDPIWKAWRLLKGKTIKILPVIQDNQILGTISDQDIVRISSVNGGQSMSVKAAMDIDPLTVSQDSTIYSTVQAMLSSNKQVAIVVDDQKKIQALFTWSDALRYVMTFSHEQQTLKKA